jgi:hypothetical protein
LADLKKTNLDDAIKFIEAEAERSVHLLRERVKEAIEGLRDAAATRKELPGIDLLERSLLATVTDFQTDYEQNDMACDLRHGSNNSRLLPSGYHEPMKQLPKGKYRALLFILPRE